MAIVVEVLVVENCPQEDAAIQLVATTAQAVGVNPRVLLLEVSDLTQAKEHGFVGSPTIRVNGRDIAPPADDQAVSLSCRLYPTRDGVSRVPDSEQLRAALVGAKSPTF